MSHPTNESSSSMQDILALVEKLLPECDPHTSGPCYMPADSKLGFVVYDNTYKNCLTRDITIPGFNLLPHWLLGVTYVVFMAYLFLGIAIASDIFMESVMTITATTRTVTRNLPDGRHVTEEVPIWNWAVANISLMALGTSSPEVVLAVMDVVLKLGKDEDSELGPSCIVGSGAYNLLIITGVCTLSVTGGVFKRIRDLRVFAYTTIFQFWVQIWMLVVYQWWTPDYVTMTEALLTLAQMPVLLAGAWAIDTQPWARNKVSAEECLPPAVELTPTSSVATPRATAKLMGDSPETLRQSSMSLKQELIVKQQPMSIRDDSAVVKFTSPSMERGTHTTMYKRRAARAMTGHMATGARRTSAGLTTASLKLAAQAGDETSTALMLPAMHDLPASCQKVMFKSSAYSVLESEGVARVGVVRYDGDMNTPLRVHFTTSEDTALEGLDFEPQEGILTFERQEDVKTIIVKIVDDDLSEPDVSFWVHLTRLEGPGMSAIVQDKVQVTIVDDDQNGVLSFEMPHYEASSTEAVVKVMRRLGTDGVVTVNYRTVDGTASAGAEYVFSEGTVVFDVGQTEQLIKVPILGFAADGAHRTFKVLLDAPDGGAELGRRSHCRVTIIKRAKHMQSMVIGSPSVAGELCTEQGVKEGKEAEEAAAYDVWAAYRKQFSGAVAMPGGEAEGENSDWLSLTLHYLCITWKLILATVPPADWKGGYPCFIASLVALAAIIYVLQEATNLMGCVFGLLPLVNGFSIVALGTSLPDTFASRIAAMADDCADTAIGNVMGSNSVNVVIGLGLPWLIGASYSMAHGEVYHQAGGDLFFSVVVFIGVALAGVAVMAWCRRLGGELGGPLPLRLFSFAIYFVLWVIFLMLASMKAYGDI